ESLIKSKNDDDEKSSDLEYDIAESGEENNQDIDCKVESRNFDNSEDVISDPIQELFAHIFVNDSWTCASSIEKLYYSAKIYLNICCNCGTTNIER
ncbi:25310_t:CDS:1, partial [Racocetra persica]